MGPPLGGPHYATTTRARGLAFSLVLRMMAQKEAEKGLGGSFSLLVVVFVTNRAK